MTDGNRPKLTLGLKKKLHKSEDDQTKNSKKLRLGSRKKAALFQPIPSTESESQTTRFKKKQQFKPQSVVDKQQTPSLSRSAGIRIPKTIGKLEINIKITELPNWVETIKRGWQRFCINVDGQIIRIKVRPRVWNKLIEANEQYNEWVASITGKMGHNIHNGFELLEPQVQVYEKVTKTSNTPTVE
jgi:hypothetical protein